MLLHIIEYILDKNKQKKPHCWFKYKLLCALLLLQSLSVWQYSELQQMVYVLFTPTADRYDEAILKLSEGER